MWAIGGKLLAKTFYYNIFDSFNVLAEFEPAFTIQ
jgi:hypothetical protein